MCACICVSASVPLCAGHDCRLELLLTVTCACVPCAMNRCGTGWHNVPTRQDKCPHEHAWGDATETGQIRVFAEGWSRAVPWYTRAATACADGCTKCCSGADHGLLVIDRPTAKVAYSLSLLYDYHDDMCISGVSYADFATKKNRKYKSGTQLCSVCVRASVPARAGGVVRVATREPLAIVYC